MPAPSGKDFQWWSVDEDDIATTVCANLDTIKTAQQQRVTNGTRYDSLYDGIDYLGVTAGWGAFDRRPKMPPISFNAVRVVGDTLVSKLMQAQNKVTFLTNGADWAERKKAEELNRFTDGEMYRLDYKRIRSEAIVDAVRQGNGYIKFGNFAGKATCERVHPSEVFVDEVETFSAPPRTMWQEHFMSRDVALAQWGDTKERRDMIENAKVAGDNQYHYFSMHVGQIIRVVEAWHLKSTDDSDDGKHVICVDSGVLFEEPWDIPRFPFAVFRLYPRSRGFYAIGLVERQIEMQLTINKLIRRKHAAIHLLAAPYFLIEAGSRVIKTHFNTDIGNFIEYLGSKPELVVNKVVNDDINQGIQEILQWMFLDAGINQMEASGVKPDGLDSGPAIESYNNTTSIRHTSMLEENQRFTKQAYECLLDQVRLVAKGGQSYETFGNFKDHAKVIDWADLDVDSEAYVMQMGIENLLPDTPAGRIQYVERLAQAGVLSPVQSVRALQSPDIEALTRDVTAPENDIEWTIFEMCKPKNARYMPPEPFQDLNGGIISVNHAYLRERDNNAPREILDNLRRWLRDADALLSEQASAAAALNSAMNMPPVQAQAQQMQGGMPGPAGAPGPQASQAASGPPVQ